MKKGDNFRVLDGERQEVREPRFPLVPFEQLTFFTQQAYLVKGLIPRVGLTVVWGPPKCGKSFWAFDLSMHVALGRKYRGRRVKGGPAVYCAFEGADGMRRRAEAFRRRFLAEEAAPVPFFLSSSPIDLVKDHAALIASIRAQAPDPVLVVLDTLNRSLAGSESDDKDMGAYIKAADAIRDAFDCAVIVVHHCGIDASRPRGHTSLAGAVDAQLVVKRDSAGNVIVTVERMKDGPEGDQIVSKLDNVELGIDEDQDPITSCVVVPSETTKGAGKSVSGAAGIALKLLIEALAELGEVPPASNHIPPKTQTIPIALWREYCRKGTIADSDKPDSQKKAFVRASNKLQSLGQVGIWNDQVWLTGHPGQ